MAKLLYNACIFPRMVSIQCVLKAVVVTQLSVATATLKTIVLHFETQTVNNASMGFFAQLAFEIAELKLTIVEELVSQLEELIFQTFTTQVIRPLHPLASACC